MSSVRRSISAQMSTLDTLRKIVRGSLQLKHLREAERNELLSCIDQTIEVLGRLDERSVRQAEIERRGL
jgi:hypothetical protein